MGQHSDKVDQRRQELKAEEWASKVYMIHAYSNDEGQSVFDVQYNDGRIQREIDGKKTTIYPNGQKEPRKTYLERIRHMFSAAMADIKAGFEPR
jgi:predicted RNA-binding protein with PIN domain